LSCSPDKCSISQQAIVYFHQLRVMQKSVQTMQETLRAQNLTGLIEYLQQPDVRKARSTVIEKLNEKPYNTWTEEEKGDASTACAAYGVAGGPNEGWGESTKTLLSKIGARA
jgi:hypothetical protein